MKWELRERLVSGPLNVKTLPARMLKELLRFHGGTRSA